MDRYTRTFWMTLALAAWPAACLAAERTAGAAELRSGPEQAALVEIYTSESRKAALEADRWAASSLKDAPGLWKEIVPVVFHVDYGEKPGWWKDRFAQKVFTQRLKAYASLWGLGRPFVPAVYVNGSEWTGWGRDESLPISARKKTGLLFARKGSVDEVDVRFKPEDTSNAYWTAHAALLGLGVVSQIDGGENSGQLLTHEFLALSYGSAPMVQKRDEFQARVRVNLKTTRPTDGLGLVVWISREDNMLPVQAAGALLQRPIRPKTR